MAALSCSKMSESKAGSHSCMKQRLGDSRIAQWAPRFVMIITLGAAIVFPLPGSYRAIAQDMNMDSGGSMILPPPGGEPSPDPSQPPPMQPMRIMQPITGSMAVAPPYGVAPLKVGFFVLATIPKEWDFSLTRGISATARSRRCRRNYISSILTIARARMFARSRSRRSTGAQGHLSRVWTSVRRPEWC